MDIGIIVCCIHLQFGDLGHCIGGSGPLKDPMNKIGFSFSLGSLPDWILYPSLI
jgi:hypothetical protein